jgi:RND superfamily putative drug exporter
MASDNLTARAARWSAAHSWMAVLGWLAFVFVAFVIGSAAGVVTMTTADGAIGDSGKADQILAGVPQPPHGRRGVDPTPPRRPSDARLD